MALQMESIPAKTIVTRNKSTEWFGCEYNMNLYRGCCHGCIYCDSRSECYHIENFDQVRQKQDALRIVRDDLRRKVRRGIVATGAMSDPYNPFERELLLTRHALELIDAFGFGAAIATKSTLIARDIDILQEIASHSPVLCKLTITTASDEMSGKIEPRAPLSSQRFETLQALTNAGIFSGILLMPVLPFVTDQLENVLSIVERAKACGARFIYPAFGMTMRTGQREWFYARLEEVFPGQELARRYRRRFGDRYVCASPRARELWSVFAKACDEAGILYRMQDIIRASRMGYESEQLNFFE